MRLATSCGFSMPSCLRASSKSIPDLTKAVILYAVCSRARLRAILAGTVLLACSINRSKSSMVLLLLVAESVAGQLHSFVGPVEIRPPSRLYATGYRPAANYIAWQRGQPPFAPPSPPTPGLLPAH